ncbi:MAG: hypothetical protein E7490_10440 [Ruminococcaceae bacterium]|nr:hypothetical protein [Oscillospiraceae bacterium]
MNERLLKVSYDMELSEIGEGFKLFQKKYQLKRTIIFTIVYAIAAVLGIDMIIRNPQNFYGYLLIGLGIGLIFMQWYRPVMIRKKLLNTLSSMTQETYETEIFSDRIQITTRVLAKENKEAETESAEENTEKEISTEESTEAEETEVQEEAVVSTFFFGSDLLDAMENEKMFLLFVNRSLIYIYPKRCLTDEEQDTMREIFTDKAIL